MFGPSGRKQMQVRDRDNPDANFLCGSRALAPVRLRGDSSGFNVCLIEASDNRSGGGKLSNFYYDNRVIDGDSFRVVAR